MSESLSPMQEHCARLSRALDELSHQTPASLSKDGETLEFSDAADWLEIAAGIFKVEVQAARFDYPYLCGTAADFEDARSDLLSRLTTQLTIFLFAWGAFETVAKIIDPPSIPKSQRTNGANSLIDRVLFRIRDFQPFPAYIQVLKQLRMQVSSCPEYAAQLKAQPLPHFGVSGLALDFVRRVRNRFAHGSLSLPLPEDDGNGWSGAISKEPEVIALSTRLVLLTTQMLLSVHYGGEHFDLDVLEDEDGFTIEADVHAVLGQLHDAQAEDASRGRARILTTPRA